jgi:hypothetical protein
MLLIAAFQVREINSPKLNLTDLGEMLGIVKVNKKKINK